MTTLSPEAQKAQAAAASRQSMWRPRLKRTTNKLVILHAVNNRRGQRRALAEKMRALGWAWDGKRGYFYTDLDPERLHRVLAEFKPCQYGSIHLNISPGVYDWLKSQKES